MDSMLPDNNFLELELSDDLRAILLANRITKISEILELTVGEWHLLQEFNYRHQVELIELINKNSWQKFVLE